MTTKAVSVLEFGGHGKARGHCLSFVSRRMPLVIFLFRFGASLVISLQRLKPLLVGLPAVTVLIAFSVLVGRGLYSANEIKVDYRVAARDAVAKNDIEAAEFYYSRLIGAGDRGSERDQLNWAMILSSRGNMDRAIELLNQLAPDDRIGFGPAHFEKAKALLATIEKSSNAEAKAAMLARMQWHLRQGAQVNSVENNLLWAQYYLGVEQIQAATDRLEAAANQNPALWYQIASFYQSMGREDDADRGLKRAEVYVSALLENNPLNTDVRLQLVSIFVAQERYDDARNVLNQGLRLGSGQAQLKTAGCELALLELSRMTETGPAAQRRRLDLLVEAANLDPNNSRVYAALIQFYQRSQTDDQKMAFRRQLEEWIGEGFQVPYAHFALGNLLWIESDADGAIFHFEQALQLQPDMAKVANNLAWVLSERDPPDLDRALRLIEIAIKSDPDQIAFQDTMGLVLFAQGKYRECLPYLEKVLSDTDESEKPKLHERLAIAYEKLGRERLAKVHRDKSEKPTIAEKRQP